MRGLKWGFVHDLWCCCHVVAPSREGTATSTQSTCSSYHVLKEVWEKLQKASLPAQMLGLISPAEHWEASDRSTTTMMMLWMDFLLQPIMKLEKAMLALLNFYFCLLKCFLKRFLNMEVWFLCMYFSLWFEVSMKILWKCDDFVWFLSFSKC